eukprot:TCONS_00051925-protein
MVRNRYLLFLVLVALQCVVTIQGQPNAKKPLSETFISSLHLDEGNIDNQDDPQIQNLRKARSAIQENGVRYARHIEQKVNDDARMLEKLSKLFEEIDDDTGNVNKRSIDVGGSKMSKEGKALHRKSLHDLSNARSKTLLHDQSSLISQPRKTSNEKKKTKKNDVVLISKNAEQSNKITRSINGIRKKNKLPKSKQEQNVPESNNQRSVDQEIKTSSLPSGKAVKREVRHVIKTHEQNKTNDVSSKNLHEKSHKPTRESGTINPLKTKDIKERKKSSKVPTNNDYSSLFHNKVKRSIDEDEEEMTIRKDDDKTKGNEKEIHGLPEALATIFDIKKFKREIKEEEHKQTEDKKEHQRYNPRAVILKRQARDRVVPNIPLPFLKSPITKVRRFVKKIQLAEKVGQPQDKHNQEPIRKSKVITVKSKNKTENRTQRKTIIVAPNILSSIIKQQEVKQEPVGKIGSIGDEQTATLSKKNQTSTEGDKQVERASRSVSEESIDSTKGKKIISTQRNELYGKTIPFEELKSLDIVRRALTDEQFNRLRFLDDQKAKSLFESDENKFLKNLTKDGIYYDTRNKRFILSADASRLAEFTKNVTLKDSTEELAILKNNITKREIILDSDPDIVTKMGGKEAKMEQDAIKKAEEVYRFARQILDIVGDEPKKKSKRETGEEPEHKKSNGIMGMWTALGSSPEFVPELVKRDTSTPSHHAARKMSLDEIRQKRQEFNSKKRRALIALDDNERHQINQRHAESPLSIAETGNLGSVNLREVRKDTITDEHVEQSHEKSKRQANNAERDINKNSAATLSNDGKVIFAFDEVKELMPSRKISTVEEASLLKPQTLTETRYDLDRDLADSMLIGRQIIPAHPIDATLVSSSFSTNGDSYGTSKNKIPILKKQNQLGPAQFSKYRSDYEKPRVEQMQRWVNETMFHPYGTERSAETDAALQKLNLASLNATAVYPSYRDNKGETSSQYLAHNLQDKIKLDDSSNEVGIDELNRDILKEQEKYKMHLEQQHQQRLEEQQRKLPPNGDDSETQSQSTEILNRLANQPTPIPLQQLPTVSNKQSETESELEHYERVHGLNMANKTELSTTNAPPTPTTSTSTQPPTTRTTSTTTTPKTTTLATTTSSTQKTTTQQPATTTTNTLKTTTATTATTTSSPTTSTLSSTTRNLTTTAIPTSTTPTTTPANTKNSNLTTDSTNASNTTTNLVSNATTPEEKNKTVNRMNVAEEQPQQTQPIPQQTSSTPCCLQVQPYTQVPCDQQNAQPCQQQFSQPTPQQMQPEAQQAQQYLNSWQQQAASGAITPTPYPSPQTPPVLPATTLTTEQQQQQYLTTATPLPYPLDSDYEMELPRNKSAPEIIPRSDGYIGCYVDRLVDGRDLPIRAGVPSVTPNNCRSVCKKSGYRYAAMQYGYLCFCGNSYGKYDMVPDSECNTMCSGDDAYTCGGLWRNKIYNTEGVDEGKEKSYKDENGVARSYLPVTPDIPTTSNTDSPPVNPYKPTPDIQEALKAAEEKDVNNYQNQIQANLRLQNIADGNYKDVNDQHQPISDNKWIELAQQKVKETLSQQKHPTRKSKEQLLKEYIRTHATDDFKELKHSPPNIINATPGTKIYRGLIKLQQLWYDDFANTSSAKFQILTGNIQIALKRIYENDTNFISAEVVSLMEADQFMPHRTIVDFVLNFKTDNIGTPLTEDPTHHLFQVVSTTKSLDGMPVLPKTLTIKEYYLSQGGNDINTQAQQSPAKAPLSPNQFERIKHDSIFYPPTPYHNKQSPWDTVIRSQLSHIQEAPFLFQQQSQQVDASRQEVPGIGTGSWTMQKPIQEQPLTGNGLPDQKPVRTYIKPAVTSNNNIAELKNYMEYQKLAPSNLGNKRNLTADIMAKKSLEVPGKENSQYKLRLFFWKDMLARRKRDEKPTTKSQIKFNVYKRKLNQNTNTNIKDSVSIIRSKRSQADDHWPITYKGDSQKKTYKQSAPNGVTLKRKKRLTLDREEDKNGFATLFNELHFDEKDMVKSDKRRMVTTMNGKEEILHRSKRTEDV